MPTTTQEKITTSPAKGSKLLMGPMIVTRYLGPTTYLGSRIKAIHRRDSETTWQTTVYWDYSLDERDNHRAAAEHLMSQWGYNDYNDDLVIIGCGWDHDALYWLPVGPWQLEKLDDLHSKFLLWDQSH
jgi:hypothetical protein